MADNIVPTYSKADISRRFWAMTIDYILVMLVIIIAGTKGWIILIILCLIYIFIKDGLMSGQSVGKKMCGIMVVDIRTNKPCDIGTSVVRQLVRGLCSILVVPELLNIFFIFYTNGRTMYDEIVDTQVINVEDYKPNQSSKSIVSIQANNTVEHISESIRLVKPKVNSIRRKGNNYFVEDSLTNYNWTLLNDTEYNEITYIFRKGGELLVSKDGDIERWQYELIVDNYSILLTNVDKTEIYSVLVLQDDFLMLNKYSKEEILYFVNKAKFQYFVKEEVLLQAKKTLEVNMNQDNL